MSFAIRLPLLGQALSLERRWLTAAEAATLADAQAVLALAREEGEAMRAAARAECARLRAEAQEEGYRDGLAAAHGLRLEAERQARRHLDQLDDELVRLVLAGIRKLLPSLPLDRLPLDAAREALRALRGASAIKVRVHPANLARLDAELMRWREAWPAIEDIHGVADDSLQRLDAVVESELGTVHATLEAQLAALELALCRGVQTSFKGE